MEQEYYYRWSAAVQWIRDFLDIKIKASVYYHCGKYPVIKRTPKGAFIDEYGRKRFILNDARKKWAAPTKEEAWINYKARSAHALAHAHNNVAKIEAARDTEVFKSDIPPVDNNGMYQLHEIQSPPSEF